MQNNLQAHIQARGFVLTDALLNATQSELQAYRSRFPHSSAVLSVRLYDVNGLRGGPDKGCLAQAKLGKLHVSIVASDVDSDLYTAIQRAFAKLTRATRSALSRARQVRRRNVDKQLRQEQLSRRDVAAVIDGFGG